MNATAPAPETLDYGDVLPPWPGETLSIPGRTLHVRHAATTGAGEPAVLIHGLGGSST
ncbi:MAG: alpha/beta hydrolase, partial [Actinobacteria bacterium]|nr:alpha/beta hydrolase [Actinomycetota bacterium]